MRKILIFIMSCTFASCSQLSSKSTIEKERTLASPESRICGKVSLKEHKLGKDLLGNSYELKVQKITGSGFFKSTLTSKFQLMALNKDVLTFLESLKSDDEVCVLGSIAEAGNSGKWQVKVHDLLGVIEASFK